MTLFIASAILWVIAFGKGRQTTIRLAKDKRRAAEFNQKNYLP